MRKGFTLIELLIVVAIIAILAAIAVPNFLEAQVRAKVSRSMNDERVMATAIEAYKIDYNTGPSDTGGGQNNVKRPYGYNYPAPNFSIGLELTTPIAYITSNASLLDVFKLADAGKYKGTTLEGREYYNFSNIGYRAKMDSTYAPTYNVLQEFIGDWVIMGAGPDKWVNNTPADTLGSGGTPDFGSTNIPRCIPYDATNGTVSNGDIYRSHKYGTTVKIRTGVQ
jgi:prepilin-type N-terminal cleavage/methylation domain-containing protein